jgi:hypothetical protein
MPKYTVKEVVDIIQTFTSDEKKELQAQLSSVASVETPIKTVGKSQEQTFGNISLGSGNIFAAHQAGGDISSAQSSIQSSVESVDLQEALGILQKLKQDVSKSDALNKLEKTTLEGTIKVIEEEVIKPKPDKSLLDQAIEGLKSGLKIVSLVEPVMKVGELIAKI